MKKAALLFLALVLTVALVACAGEGERPQGTGTPASSAADQDAYVFPVPAADGYTLAVNEDMEEALSCLGEPASYFEAASCAFDGLDKTYTYSGFVITTRPEGEKDIVNSILLTDDSVTTAEGVYIGCGEQDVIDAYGSQTAEGNVLTYTRDGVTLNFILQDGQVQSIEYFSSAS